MSPCQAESNLTIVCPGYEPISGIWTRDLNKRSNNFEDNPLSYYYSKPYFSFGKFAAIKNGLHCLICTFRLQDDPGKLLMIAGLSCSLYRVNPN
jgi:hypothetical protein